MIPLCRVLNYLIMRKLSLFFLVLLLPFSAFDMDADDKDAVMKIPLKMDTGKNLCRTIVQESLECYYYDMMNVVVTTVWEDMGDVFLTVTNSSTGSVWYASFNSSHEFQNTLCISGEPGVYEISYITESGNVYVGEFILN